MTSRREFFGRMFRLPERAASAEPVPAADVPESPGAERPEDPAPARLAARMYGAAMTAAFGEEAEEPALPPDFTPALLRLEGERLGLDAGSMTHDELVRAVLAEMSAIRPPEETGGRQVASRRCPRQRRGRNIFLHRKEEGRG